MMSDYCWSVNVGRFNFQCSTSRIESEVCLRMKTYLLFRLSSLEFIFRYGEFILIFICICMGYNCHVMFIFIKICACEIWHSFWHPKPYNHWFLSRTARVNHIVDLIVILIFCLTFITIVQHSFWFSCACCQWWLYCPSRLKNSYLVAFCNRFADDWVNWYWIHQLRFLKKINWLNYKLIVKKGIAGTEWYSWYVRRIVSQHWTGTLSCCTHRDKVRRR